MSALFRASDDPAPLMEINTTPLIDVLLVLLIVLILTMPPLTHRTSMELGTGLPGKPRDAIEIEIAYDGSIDWNGTTVGNLADLEKKFRAIAAQADQPDIRVNASRAVKYEAVVQVLAVAQRNGVERVGFVGQERFDE
jgi:biopolymer transport protein ExbD